jgi:hypothetical protein
MATSAPAPRMAGVAAAFGVLLVLCGRWVPDEVVVVVTGPLVVIGMVFVSVLVVEAVLTTVVEAPVWVGPPPAVAENCTHSCEPTLAATPRSLAAQAAMRHGAARRPMSACFGPHWQAWSVGAQPAAEMAETRQDVWQLGQLRCASAKELSSRSTGVRRGLGCYQGHRHTAQAGSPERFCAMTPAAAAMRRATFIL